MAKQTFTTGQVLLASQLSSLQQTAMGGGSPSTKTASYVLVAADAGTVIQMNSASSTTITVNTSLFSAGDSVQIQNIGSGTMTITAGSATVNSAGSLAVSQYDGGFLYFSSASSAIWFDYTQPGTASPLTTKGDLYTRTSSADSRLAVGANGTTLVADSSEATGLKWATASGGGMTVIGETSASALSSLTFSGFGTYKQLLLTWAGVKHSATGTLFGLRFNNNSTAGAYAGIDTTGDRFNQASLINQAVDKPPFGRNASAAGKETHAEGYVLIDNVSSATKSKSFQFGYGYFNNTTAVSETYFGVGAFYSTTAITTVDIVRLSGSDTFTNQNDTTIRLLGIS